MNQKVNPYHFGQLLINPGNVADELVILEIKRERIAGEHPEIQEGICRASLLLDAIAKPFSDEVYNQLNGLMNDLQEVNEIQWDLEDRVRFEKSGEAAFAARENNSIRVGIKNKISQLFGYPIEVKSYKG